MSQSTTASDFPVETVHEGEALAASPLRRDQFEAHLASQPTIIRALHTFLKGFQIACIALAGIFWIVAIIITIRWAVTGVVGNLAEAWVNYGLAMSLIVFPMGLDVMLLRANPTDIYSLDSSLNVKKDLHTGVKAFFMGFGITFGGLPGFVYIGGLLLEFIAGL